MDARYFWLIWSYEHDAFWKDKQNGYTTDRKEAGRYSFSEACRIVFEANKFHQNEAYEGMIRDESLCCRAPMIDFVQCETCGSRA